MPGTRPGEAVKDSPEYNAVFKYLDGHSEDEALDALCEPIEDAFMKTQNPEDVEGLLWRAWKSITAIAARTPHDSGDRQKLADLVARLQSRRALESQGTVCNVWDAEVWQDLPVFGAQMRQAWNGAATSTASQEAQSTWLNLNAFSATLLATGYSKAVFQELSLFGLWTIRTALEEEEQPDPIAQDAAALWFILSSPVLWDLCHQSKTFDGKIAKPGFMFKDESWRGFSKERWQTWEKRMQGAGSSALVEKARSAMSI